MLIDFQIVDLFSNCFYFIAMNSFLQILILTEDHSVSDWFMHSSFPNKHVYKIIRLPRLMK